MKVFFVDSTNIDKVAMALAKLTVEGVDILTSEKFIRPKVWCCISDIDKIKIYCPDHAKDQEIDAIIEKLKEKSDLKAQRRF
jgi:hypothetical protein